MSHPHDWLKTLEILCPDHHPSEELLGALRRGSPAAADDVGVLVAGPKVASPLAERLLAKGPLGDDQLALLEEFAVFQEELIDRKLQLFADYLTAAVRRRED